VDPRSDRPERRRGEQPQHRRCVGFLFDYLFRDPSIPPRFRRSSRDCSAVSQGGIAGSAMFTDKKNPARRLLDELAAAAVCAEDDEPMRRRMASSQRRSWRRSGPNSSWTGCLRLCVRSAAEVFRSYGSRERRRRCSRRSDAGPGRGGARCRSFTRARAHSRQAFRNQRAVRHSNVRRNRLGGLHDERADLPTASRAIPMLRPSRSWTTCCGPARRNVGRARRRGSR
jgi:hypothetical protein